MKGFQLERRQTLREQIVSAIRDAIIRGDLKPGEKVTEMDLAGKFGISRTPIREAFHQLESEGFLTLIPRRGALVAPISEQDVSEFYEIKSLLEGYAARQACEVIPDSDIDRMAELNQKITDYSRQGGDMAMEVHRYHNEFHDLFLRYCENSKLLELTRSLTLKFQRFRIALSFSGYLEESINQHNQIIEAFRRRDPEAVEQAVRENAIQGGKSLIQILRSQKKEEEEAAG